MNRTYRKIFLLLFVFMSVLGLLSCSQLAFWKSAAEEEIIRAEEYLAGTIDTLMRLDPAVDTDEYLQARSKFEEALERYMLVAGKADRSIIHLDFKGTNIIIPVHRLDHFDDQIELLQTRTAQTLWQRIGPVFRDEIVDLAAIHDDNSIVTLAALFTDSLVVFPPTGSDDDPQSIKIPSRNLKDIRSRIPSGLMETRRDEIYFITAHSDTSFRFTIRDETTTPAAHWYPFDIQSVTGRPYFEYVHDGNMKNILSVKQHDENDRYVILDDRGKLHLYSNNDNSSLYTSEQPLGNRLFKINGEKFAITRPDENSFVLAELYSDTVHIKGLSPQFYGTVGAVTYAELSGIRGYIVGVTTGNDFTGRYSQLYFVPEQMIQWREVRDISPPLFPDYNARFVMVDHLGNIFDASEIQDDLHPFVHPNVYETLLLRDANGELVYNLASSIQPDMMQKRWSISLKEGVRFSDGSILDANMVRDAWFDNMKKCNESACVMKWVSEKVDTIEVVDSLQLIINLDLPLPNFKEHLTANCFQITKIHEEEPWPIGTGAYMVTESSSRQITLRRNPYYHRGESFLEEIVIMISSDDVIEYVTQHEKTGAFIRQPRYIDFFGAIDALQKLKAQSQKIYFLALNPDSPRLTSTNARSRVIQTIGREALVTVVTEARTEIATSFFSDIDISMEKPDNDRSNLASNSLRILYLAQDPVAEQIAQRLSVRLQQVGIQVRRPEGLSRGRFQQVRNDQGYDILVDSYLPFFSSSAYNLYDLLQRGYIFDEVLEEQAAALITPAGAAEIARIEEYAAEQYYLYPLLRTSMYAVTPVTLYEVDYAGRILLNFSEAWFPK